LSPEQVRKLRAALGLSQTELGNLLEVSQATVSLWENGHQDPANGHVARIRDLARERGVDLEVGAAEPGADDEPLLFGAWLARERTAQGLTRRELADRSSVSYQQIRNLEIGESENPQERTRSALEDALGTDTPEAVEEATDEESEIEDVGRFISFDPHDEDSYPEEPRSLRLLRHRGSRAVRR
jgi:transcriptional regulator with XRE-family HTH domain